MDYYSIIWLVVSGLFSFFLIRKVISHKKDRQISKKQIAVFVGILSLLILGLIFGPARPIEDGSCLGRTTERLTEEGEDHQKEEFNSVSAFTIPGYHETVCKGFIKPSKNNNQ